MLQACLLTIGSRARPCAALDVRDMMQVMGVGLGRGDEDEKCRGTGVAGGVMVDGLYKNVDMLVGVVDACFGVSKILLEGHNVSSRREDTLDEVTPEFGINVRFTF